MSFCREVDIQYAHQEWRDFLHKMTQSERVRVHQANKRRCKKKKKDFTVHHGRLQPKVLASQNFCPF